MAAESQVRIVTDALHQVEAGLRDEPARQPVGSDVLLEQAVHFADAVRFALHRPEAMYRLQAMTDSLAAADSLEAFLRLALDHCVTITAADLGGLQVLDPSTGALLLVAHRGFDDELAERHALTAGSRTPCGRAVRRRSQVVVEDAGSDADLVALGLGDENAPFLAVQSTPLKDYTGRVLGVLSTHWLHPRVPDVADLRMVELYADYAGDQLSRRLGRTPPAESGDDVGPIARAMILELLHPPGWAADATPRPGVPPQRGGVDLPGPMVRAFPDDRLASFADLVVTGLFTTGLDLDGARGRARERHPDDRVLAERLASATGDLDRLLTQVRGFMVGEDHLGAESGDGDPGTTA